MEGKQRLLQLLALSTGPAIDVVQHYFEVKIIYQYRDFEDYLNDPQNKHKLFHERYPKIPCCECIRTTSISAPSKRGCVGFHQFSKLYDENGTVTAGHEKIRGSQISQHCLCKVSAQKTVKVIDIDITLLNAIIQHCCPLHITSKISRWMTDIKEVRNTCSHWAEGKLDKNLFDQTWKKLETATLECAGDIGHSCVKIFKIAIDQITSCSVAGLGERILENTKILSEVREDLNGVIPLVRTILSKQTAVTDKISIHSKDLTEVKTGVAGVNTAVAAIKTDVAGVNTAVDGVDTKVGDVNHRLSNIEFMVGMILKRQGENLEVYDMGEKKRKVTIDVDATSSTWDEERTTCNLAVAVQPVQNDKDNDNNEEFRLEKVENRCIYLELSASPELFKSPLKLRNAIKSLIRQFVKAGELDENVPATVVINITVKSDLTIEEKNVVYKVFSANDTLDGLDYDDELQIDQKPTLRVKASTTESDQQIASTSASEIQYSRHKTNTTGVNVKTERQENAIELTSVHIENVKFNLQIKGRPSRLSNSSDTEPEINIEESTDVSVIWTWHCTQNQHSWNVLSIVETINRKMSNLRDWFHVDYAYSDTSGRLALQTTTASHTFSSLPSIEMAVKSFLGKFIELCDLRNYLGDEQLINIDVTSQSSDNKDKHSAIIGRELKKSRDTIHTWGDSNKDLECLVCRKNKNLIAKLNDKLQEQRETIMGLQKRMSIFEEETEGLEDDAHSTDDKEEDMDLHDSVLRKRKQQTEISRELQENDTDMELKKLKMTTATENESTGGELLYVIDKEKALQKLGEILLIDMKIKEEQAEKEYMLLKDSRETAVTIPNFLNVVQDCLISELRRHRNKKTGIVERLTEIVITNRNKLVKREDKRYLKDLDFLKLNLASLHNKCQQCSSQGFDMTGVCTNCERICCDDCIRKHTKKFPDHEYAFRDAITRGLEYHGEIFIESTKDDLFELVDTRVIDMKSVKGMVVIIMKIVLNFYLCVYSAMEGQQFAKNHQLTMELDEHKSQIDIIDDNTVAITAPCHSCIYIVNFITDKITTIECMNDMTGAIAFIEGNLYVACSGHILTMNLQGENHGIVSLPGIKFLHPGGQNKMYCVSSINILYFDMTSMEEHQLSEFPYPPECLTSDGCGNLYFISKKAVWKSANDGTGYKVVLTQERVFYNPKRIFFDISNNLLLVQINDRKINIYRKV